MNLNYKHVAVGAAGLVAYLLLAEEGPAGDQVLEDADRSENDSLGMQR